MKEKTQIQGIGQGQIKNDNLQQWVKTPQIKTTKVLEPAVSAITMQGGLLYPIGYKEVLAGEYIRNVKIQNLTRMLTPLVPTLDKVFIKIDAWFVPLTRIWESAEKKLAGKNDKYNMQTNQDGSLEKLPTTTINGIQTEFKPFMYTLAHRYGIPFRTNHITLNPFLYRGYRAIVNDFIINKDYELPKTEWKGDGVSEEEKKAIDGYGVGNGIFYDNAYVLEPVQTRKGYLTNIKSKLSADMDPLATTGEGAQIGPHLDWQARYNDAKQRQNNANKNDWEIIAEMGGTQPIHYNQVEHLGSIEYQLNYQQITQSAPTIDNSSPLGTTGSFSYTKADGTLFSHKEFKQHGHIHFTINLQIDKRYERSINKELLKSSVEDIYRPGLADKEIQLLQSQEVIAGTIASPEPVAYQPAWSEYKRLPSLTTGEMQTSTLGGIEDKWKPSTSNSQWHNIISKNILTPSGLTIDGKYFRNADEVNEVLARNNILQLTFERYFDNNLGYKTFENDPILNMCEITCETSLPIGKNTIDQVEYTDEKR